MGRFRLAALVTLFLMMLVGLAAGAPVPSGSYAVYDLGTLGGTRSEAYDINDHGQVSGYSYAGGPETYGFVWQNGVMRKLGAFPGGKNSTAFANVGGVAVGFAEGRVTNYTYWTNINTGQVGTNTVVSNYFKACRWVEGSLEALDGLMPGGGGHAQAVNYGGVIAGYTGWSFTNQFDTNVLTIVDRAVRWSSGGDPTDLGPGPWSQSRAYGLNNLGDVVGTAIFNVHSNGSPTHAILFGSPYRDLHTLTNHVNSVALAINNLGQVVGYSFNVPTHVFDEPFFWSEATGMKRLTTPPGDPYGQALDINDSGTAVGFVGRTAAMWLNAGQTNETLVLLQNLLRPGEPFALKVATSINAAGEITGYGQNHAFLLYPTNTRHRIDGTITFVGTDLDALTLTNALADVSVELFAERDGALVARASGWADSEGRFSFLLPAWVDTRYALKVSLADRDGLLAVYDISRDTNEVGWLRTPSFNVTADTRADIVMTINANTTDVNHNEAAYELNGRSFTPALSSPEPAPALLPASNTGGERFAHLAAIYRNTRLAAHFAVDRLGLEMPMASVHAFEPGAWQAWSAWTTNASGTARRERKYGPSTRFRHQPPTILIPDIGSAYNEPFVGVSATNLQGDAIQRQRVPAGGVLTNIPTPLNRNRPDNREFHEYGHFIMLVSPIAGSGAMPPRVPGVDTNHAGLLNHDSADSWVEGWASFISMVISDVMLDRGEKARPEEYRVWGTPVNLDALFSYHNPNGTLYLKEERIVSSSLWDIYDGSSAGEAENLNLPLDNLWQLLRANQPSLLHFKAVTDALLTFSTNNPFVLPTAELVTRLVQAELFDHLSLPPADPGFGDRIYDPGETIGQTSWNPNYPHRNAEEPWDGSFVALAVTDGAAVVLGDMHFDIAIEYDPPLDHRNTRYTFFAPGPGPHAVPLDLPPHPSRAVIRAKKPGYSGGDQFVVTAEEFWAAPKSPAAGEVDPFLAEHTFILTAGGANLALTYWPAGAAVPVGGMFSIAIGVTNLGPSNATLVTLTNTLPAEVSLVSALPSQGSWFVTNGAVVCQLGDLAAGAGASVQLEVRALETGQIPFAATVSAAESDPAPENDQQTLTLDVVGPPTILMSVAPFGGPITLSWAGGGARWTVEYANNLAPPVEWRPVPFPTFEGPDGASRIIMARPPFNAFFRLRHP